MSFSLSGELMLLVLHFDIDYDIIIPITSDMGDSNEEVLWKLRTRDQRQGTYV